MGTSRPQGRSYRSIAAEYGVKAPPSAITSSMRLIKSEQNLQQDAVTVEPALLQMRKLNNHVLKLLARAEVSDDRETWLGAMREGRRNLELIARLTGELDPRNMKISVAPVRIRNATFEEQQMGCSGSFPENIASPEIEAAFQRG